MKPKLLSCFLTSLIILPLVLTPTRSQSQTNGNSAPPQQLAQAETFTPATINGTLDSNSKTQNKDKTYYNTHTLEGKAGEQITIELTSSEFIPRLLLADSEKLIDYDYAAGNNARITVTLPATGTYYILANAAEAGKTGNYTLSWREATADDLELAEAEKLNRQVLELGNQGKYDTAIPLAENALKIRQRILGAKHPDIARSLNSLAGLYESQGRYAEAEPLFRQALAMLQEILPAKHPDIATSLNNLAALYQSQGRYAEAEPLYRQALAMYQEILPEKHPTIATSLNNLATLYKSQGRYAEAEPLYRQALAMLQEI
ncbi:tetratricopeptide repeat protein, partial [Limnofasciculus baicalensis]